MLSDPVRVADTRAWLHKVRVDLRGADVELNAEPPVVEHVVFHAQQAAEKAMKAFLTWHDRPFRRTHDLGELGRACLVIDPSLLEVCRRAEALTVFAWVFRYPGDTSGPSREEAADALRVAREVFDAILARLPAGM